MSIDPEKDHPPDSSTDKQVSMFVDIFATEVDKNRDTCNGDLRKVVVRLEEKDAHKSWRLQVHWNAEAHLLHQQLACQTAHVVADKATDNTYNTRSSPQDV